MPFTTRPLDGDTAFHPECGQEGISHRAVKEERVRSDRAHAALVLDADGAAVGRFLFSATVEVFEARGFSRGRQVGKHAWIVSRVVEPA